jgi:hypothetical protein
VRWKKQQSTGLNDPFIALTRTSKNKMATHAGPLGQLKDIEGPLLRHIFELREQGVTVSTFQVVVRASQLSPAFDAEHFTARCSAVKHFVRANSFVYKMGTHLSQRPPEDVLAEAKDYMRLIRPFLVGPHRDRHFIINMDQMPVYFAMNAKKHWSWWVQKQSTYAHQRTTPSG